MLQITRQTLRVAELTFIILSLLFCSGGVLNIILAGGVSQGDLIVAEPDLIISRYVAIGIAIVASMLCIPYAKFALYLLFREKWMVLMVLLALCSIAWSFTPEVTIRRSLGLVATTTLGAYFAIRYKPKHQLYILAGTFALAIVLCFVFAIALPRYGISGGVHAGDWRGIYFTKNVLGKMMFLSSAIFWVLAINSVRFRLWFWTGFALSVLLILLSTSVAALFNLLIFLTLILILQALRWEKQKVIAVLCFAAALLCLFTVWLIANLDAVFNLVGRDATLTGRSLLWSTVLFMINRRFWIGYGYNGFWNGRLSEAGEVWKATNWTPPDSHNGFLELWLDLGFIGVVLFAISFSFALTRSIKLIRSDHSAVGSWPIAYLIYLLAANSTESSFLGPNSIFWIIYMSITLSLQKQEILTRLAAATSIAPPKISLRATVFNQRELSEDLPPVDLEAPNSVRSIEETRSP